MIDSMVSIIVPIYNSEKYLKKCIDSIMAQTYNNWELLLINDGSSDSSETICRAYSEHDPHIKCISQDNSGVSVARNVGINMANGEYLCFIDSDDVVSPHYIEHLVRLKNNFSVDWALSAVERYDDFKPNQKILLDFDKLDGDSFYLLNTNYVLFGPCCKLYETSIVRDNHILFPINCQYGEDLIFNFSYMRFIKNAIFCNVNDYSYVKVNNSSLSSRYRENMFNEELYLAKIKRNFYLEKNVYDKRYREFINQGIFDMGYNAILSTFYRHVNDDIYDYISNIIENSQFQNSIIDIPKGKYSFVIMWLMKHKKAKILMRYLKLRENV